MKQTIFLAACALVGMSACTQNEVLENTNDRSAIQFSTYVGQSSRASVIDDAALKLQNFGVFAYHTGQNNWGDTNTPDFMYNQKVTYNNTDSKWEYSPVKYWPNNSGDKVSFFAYAPYCSTETANNIKLTVVGSMTAPKIEFAVNNTVASQTDLLWGTNETGADAGTPYKDQTKQKIDENIHFYFKHALARVGFQVQAVVDEVKAGNNAIAEGTTISVEKVEVKGKFYDKGTLNLNNTQAGTANWEGLTTPSNACTFELTNTNNFEDVASNVTTTATKLNKDDSYLMIIPQNMNTDKFTIEVTYKVTTTDVSLKDGKSEITNVITSEELTTDFEASKAYTFTLKLGMTSVKFEAAVQDWGDETKADVNVPQNKETDKEE